MQIFPFFSNIRVPCEIIISPYLIAIKSVDEMTEESDIYFIISMDDEYKENREQSHSKSEYEKAISNWYNSADIDFDEESYINYFNEQFSQIVSYLDTDILNENQSGFEMVLNLCESNSQEFILPLLNSIAFSELTDKLYLPFPWYFVQLSLIISKCTEKCINKFAKTQIFTKIIINSLRDSMNVELAKIREIFENIFSKSKIVSQYLLSQGIFNFICNNLLQNNNEEVFVNLIQICIYFIENENNYEFISNHISLFNKGLAFSMLKRSRYISNKLFMYNFDIKGNYDNKMILSYIISSDSYVFHELFNIAIRFNIMTLQNILMHYNIFERFDILIIKSFYEQISQLNIAEINQILDFIVSTLERQEFQNINISEINRCLSEIYKIILNCKFLENNKLFKIIPYLIPYDMQALEIVIPMFRNISSPENCQIITDFFLQQDNCFKVFIEDTESIISGSKSPLINEFFELSKNFIKESLETNNLQLMDPSNAIIPDITSENNVFFKIAKICLKNFQNFSDLAKTNIIAYINAFIISCDSKNDSQILLTETIFPLIRIISENEFHGGIIFTILCTITTLEFIYPYADVNFWKNLLEISMNLYENNIDDVEIEDFVCFIGNIIEICVPFEEIKNENKETVDIQITNYGIPKEQIKDIMIIVKESLYNIVAFKDKKEIIMMLINLSIHSDFYEIIPELMDDVSEVLGENEANGDDTLIQNLYFLLVKAVSRQNEAVFHEIVESFLNSDTLNILEEFECSLNEQIAFYATKILTLFENIEID